MWDGEGREWFRNWVENLEMKVGTVEKEIKVMGDNLRGALEEMRGGRETIRGGGITVDGMKNIKRARKKLGRC